ncbi:MAG: inositol monophosphatase family protein [Candidatus Levybacteria bacterium]|nr:inositol monophosphatase family protein [Candidatus Levybacteria bacterium]
MTNLNEGPRPSQGELGINIPKELSELELAKKATLVLTQYVEKVLPILHQMVLDRGGKQELGPVPGRPGEQQLLIDAVGQERLTNTIRENELPAIILGEHNETHVANGHKNKVIFAHDPFDNTSQHKRDLPTSVFSVLSAYHEDGKPIGGVVIDIKAKKAYMSLEGKNTLVTYEIVEETDEKTQEKRLIAKTVKTEEITRSQRKTLSDPNATLATFLGENEYNLPFFRSFPKLIESLQRKTMIYPEGGAFIYALLAAGKIDAYIMLKEPRTEIDPGLALAKTAGCTIVSVDPETGAYEEYNFDPTRNKNKEDVQFFIASATPEIRDEIIKYFIEGKRENEIKKAKLAVADLHPEEVQALLEQSGKSS